jgi:two-component system, NtrC family, sensor kinase
MNDSHAPEPNRTADPPAGDRRHRGRTADPAGDRRHRGRTSGRPANRGSRRAAARLRPVGLIAVLGFVLVLGFDVLRVAHPTSADYLSAISLALLALLLVSHIVASGRVLRLARADLAEEHLQLERTFSEARNGIALADESDRWVRVNPALCEMLGYEESELVGRSPLEFTHPDDVELTRANLDRRRRRDYRGADVEKRYVAKDGRIVWVELSASAAGHHGSGAEQHVIQIQDISARKQAELAFAVERRLLDAFMANIPEQVYFKDLESRFIRVSQVQAARLGIDDPQAVIGLSDFDLFGPEHARRAYEDEQEIIRTGVPIVEQEELETAGAEPGSGAETWVLTTKLPLRDERGEIVGTFGVSRDITRRKRAELALRESVERWRALLAHLNEIVVLVDDERLMTYATPSIEYWLGYPADELVGTPIARTSHPDDLTLVQRAFDAVTPEQPIEVTHRVRHRDGSWHTLDSTFVCLRADPVVQAVLIASTDITDRIAVEEERERLELERRVSHRLEAVGQLAAGIAHEINTPLQFVGDSVAFLREAVDDLLGLVGRYRELMWSEDEIALAQRQEIITAAEQDADLEYLLERIPAAFDRTADGVSRVRSIVQAMKRFSHSSAAEASPADINEAIETTLEVCRNTYKYVADVVLDLGELPLVTCNISELNQVFLNLVINAAQAIEEQVGDGDGRGRIMLSTRREGDAVVIVIADDGPGIPAELRERIYEPFFTTKAVGKGTGQGLALVRTTVERHSGTVECESAPGEGTTFTLRLPIEPAAPVAKAA